MKSLLLLCALACLAATSVRSQTTNYIMEAYNSAVLMKSYYDEEVEYFREMLTYEADDMGYYFTDLVAQGIALVDTAAQGAAIQECGFRAADLSQENIEFMEYYINAAERAANDLHTTVLLQLRNMNIKEYDLELFYYYHSYTMDDAYYDLWYWYSDNMFYSWLIVYIEFFYVNEELYDCIVEVL